MRRIAVVSSIILTLAVLGAAQGSQRYYARASRTVTNTDLDKFKQQRLAGEREYRENYAELGFPSPEELDRQFEESRVEREELSAKLREERIERERIAVDRVRAEAELAAAYSADEPPADDSYQSFYGVPSYGGYGPYFGGFSYRLGRRGFGRLPYSQRSYFGLRYGPLSVYSATPVGVYGGPSRFPMYRSRIFQGRRWR